MPDDEACLPCIDGTRRTDVAWRRVVRRKDDAGAITFDAIPPTLAESLFQKREAATYQSLACYPPPARVS